jgi:hypothetical protein
MHAIDREHLAAVCGGQGNRQVTMYLWNAAGEFRPANSPHGLASNTAWWAGANEVNRAIQNGARVDLDKPRPYLSVAGSGPRSLRQILNVFGPK